MNKAPYIIYFPSGRVDSLLLFFLILKTILEKEIMINKHGYVYLLFEI